MQHERHTAPPDAPKHPFQPTVVIGVPVGERDSAQVTR
jgi:hypothetical protein